MLLRFLLFSVLMLAASGVLLMAPQWWETGVEYYQYGFVVLLFFSFLVIALRYIFPMYRIGKQIRNLLRGKVYKDVPMKRKDEIGDMAHFYNRIIRGIEAVVSDVEQSKRLGEQVEVAREIQEHVLPKSVSMIPYLDVMVRSKQADEMGGDSFDFISFPGKTYFYVGDATGHGIPAGLIMMMVNVAMHTLTTDTLSTAQILHKVNDLLYPRMLTTRFMTMTFFAWDHNSRSLRFSGAGHEYILLYRSKTQTVEVMKSGGIAIGMVKDNTHIVTELGLPFDEGDVLLLYSDGITEASNEGGELYGQKRLEEQFKEARLKGQSVEEIFQTISKDVAKFMGNSLQRDDMTLMIMEHINDPQGAQHIRLSSAKDKDNFWE